MGVCYPLVSYAIKVDQYCAHMSAQLLPSSRWPGVNTQYILDLTIQSYFVGKELELLMHKKHHFVICLSCILCHYYYANYLAMSLHKCLGVCYPLVSYAIKVDQYCAHMSAQLLPSSRWPGVNTQYILDLTIQSYFVGKELELLMHKKHHFVICLSCILCHYYYANYLAMSLHKCLGVCYPLVSYAIKVDQYCAHMSAQLLPSSRWPGVNTQYILDLTIQSYFVGKELELLMHKKAHYAFSMSVFLCQCIHLF